MYCIYQSHDNADKEGNEMATVLVISQTGGVGKSTLANESAFSLDRTQTPYSFFDLDEQGGGAHETIECEDAELAIVDTPGRITDEWPEWLRNADVVVVPVRASMLEQAAFERVREMLDQYAPDVPHLIVLTHWNRYTTNREFLSWLEESKEPQETILTIPLSEAILRAQSENESVVTSSRKSSSAVKVMEFVNAVRTLAGLSEEQQKSRGLQK